MLDSKKINYYLSRVLQELSMRTGLDLGKPTGCIVLLTNRCNARCVHCHSWKLGAQGDELSTAEWEDVLGQLRRWLGPAFLSITGGETLLRKDALRLAGFAAKQGFWTEFLTNGYLMDREAAAMLVRSGLKRIKVSLDGSTAAVHDLIRGRAGFFDHATRALGMLAEEKKRSNSSVVLWAKTSIMSHNVRDLADIAAKVRELDLDGVEYQALEPIYYSPQLQERQWYRDNPLWVNDLHEASLAVDQLKTMKSQGYPIVNTEENLEMIRAYFHDPEGLAYKVHSHEYKKKKKPRCTFWVGGLQIMPDGGLKMCHFMEPFANTRSGPVDILWKNRAKCWTRDCRFLKLR